MNLTLDNSLIVFLIVYLSFLLDNVLLTVVVPIIPDYLFFNHLNITKGINHLGPTSLSPLQRKFESLEKENGPLGTLLASKAFVQLAFTPIVCYISNTFGTNLPLLIGSFNTLLATILFAYGNSYGILILARALHGTASAAIAISGMSILAKKLPVELRSKFMPIAFGGIALGVLIGYPLGGAAYQNLGKAAPFLIIGFFISLNIILQVLFLPEENSNSFNQEATLTTTYEQCVELLRDKKILITTLAICVSTSSMAVLEPCVPMWLLTKFKPRPTKWELGAVFIPDSIGYFLGSHFTGLIAVKPWRMSIVSMVIICLSCSFLPLAIKISDLTIPHLGIGLGVGIIDASLVPLLAIIADGKGCNQYGNVYALQQASVAVAYLTGPILGGYLVEVITFDWLMRFLGFLNILITPLLLELDNIIINNCNEYEQVI